MGKMSKAEEERIVEQARQILRSRGGKARARKLSARRRSEIARLGGGGGHRAAAGFTIRLTPDELVAWLEPLVERQLRAVEEGGGA